MQRVPDLVDRERFVLFQLAFGVEGFFLEEAADRVVRTEEVVVRGRQLVLGGKDAAVFACIEFVDNLMRSWRRAAIASMLLKPGMTR
ncbi:hypothetical protein LP420_27655 [Massilia sp. B-10]|nr:hypothetical protein LP420_27655 [Massilia sp. B-10]